MITPTQSKVLAYIRAFVREHEYSPTLAEIAKGLGLRAKSVISRAVHALAAADQLELLPGERRAIRLKPLVAPHIPLLGTIAAGQPIEAIAEVDADDVITLLLNAYHAKPFALKVKGDSMIEEGILDGDIVLCEQNASPQNGDVVVALIDNGAATLKHFYAQKNGTVLLVPANITHTPQVYEAARVTIQGIFRGLIRLRR
jgi:repressor LexA